MVGSESEQQPDFNLLGIANSQPNPQTAPGHPYVGRLVLNSAATVSNIQESYPNAIINHIGGLLVLPAMHREIMEPDEEKTVGSIVDKLIEVGSGELVVTRFSVKHDVWDRTSNYVSVYSTIDEGRDVLMLERAVVDSILEPLDKKTKFQYTKLKILRSIEKTDRHSAKYRIGNWLPQVLRLSAPQRLVLHERK